jgi:hypothetical protein
MWTPASNAGKHEEKGPLLGSAHRHALGVVFYKVRHDKGEPFMNRLAAFVTGGTCSHVELRFPDGNSTGIYSGEEVFMKQRSYSNPQYLQYEISVTPDQMHRMRCFANRQVGKKFNKWGMYRASLPFFWKQSDGHLDDGTWFCSELALATLQAGSICTGKKPGQFSPNTLYSFCKRGKFGIRPVLTVNQHILQQDGLKLNVFKQTEGCAQKDDLKGKIISVKKHVPV